MELKSLPLYGGISVLDSIVETYQYAPHWHEEYVIAVYRDGAKNYQCGRYRGVAQTSDLLIISPGTVHSAKTFDGLGWNYLSLYMDSAQFSLATGVEEEAIFSRISDFSQLSGRTGFIRKLFQVFDGGSAAELAFGEWLIELLQEIPDNPGFGLEIPPYLVRAYERIMDDPSRPLTLDELSSLAGVSPEHLSRSFKDVYGISPFQLLIAGRIQRAKTLISTGSPLSDAAVAAGFSDQSHMTRWMKRAFGINPGVIRKYQ